MLDGDGRRRHALQMNLHLLLSVQGERQVAQPGRHGDGAHEHLHLALHLGLELREARQLPLLLALPPLLVVVELHLLVPVGLHGHFAVLHILQVLVVLVEALLDVLLPLCGRVLGHVLEAHRRVPLGVRHLLLRLVGLHVVLQLAHPVLVVAQQLQPLVHLLVALLQERDLRGGGHQRAFLASGLGGGGLVLRKQAKVGGLGRPARALLQHARRMLLLLVALWLRGVGVGVGLGVLARRGPRVRAAASAQQRHAQHVLRPGLPGPDVCAHGDTGKVPREGSQLSSWPWFELDAPVVVARVALRHMLWHRHAKAVFWWSSRHAHHLPGIGAQVGASSGAQTRVWTRHR
mmetsp:Transcript_13091/g.25012  ORF Transcript_13091/g.25012 Transcript_13091/m.25012 type:complete len:347 (-) Transcript_13091:663-1703(-)